MAISIAHISADETLITSTPSLLRLYMLSFSIGFSPFMSSRKSNGSIRIKCPPTGITCLCRFIFSFRIRNPFSGNAHLYASRESESLRHPNFLRRLALDLKKTLLDHEEKTWRIRGILWELLYSYPNLKKSKIYSRDETDKQQPIRQPYRAIVLHISNTPGIMNEGFV